MDKKHEGGTVQVEILHRGPIRPCPSKVFKTTFCTVAHFRVQISPKYFYSQEPQAHITFNSSQIFKTHLSMFETRLTNPERQMKHENRLSLFLTDSHGKIIDFQKIEEELGSTLVRGKAYNSATWPFSKFPEKI